MEDEHRDVQGQTNTGIDEDKMDTLEAGQTILPRNNPMVGLICQTTTQKFRPPRERREAQRSQTNGKLPV